MAKRIFEKDIAFLENQNSLQSKFGIKIVKAGFTTLPVVLLMFKKILKLTYFDLIFVSYIFMRKQNGKWPYISLIKMSRDFKISQDTLNKSVKRLRSQYFLRTTPKRENPKGKGRNIYDLSGLISCLEILIDKSGKLLNKEKWKLDDHLDFMVLKDLERESLRKTESSQCKKQRT